MDHRAPACLLDLPPELISEIVSRDELSLEDHQSLRQVHQTFAIILSSRIFHDNRSLTLSGGHHHLKSVRRLPAYSPEAIERDSLRKVYLDLFNNSCNACADNDALRLICALGSDSWRGLHISINIRIFPNGPPASEENWQNRTPDCLDALSNLNSLTVARSVDPIWPPLSIDPVLGVLIRSQYLSYLRLDGSENRNDRGTGMDVNTVLMRLPRALMPRLKTLDMSGSIGLWEMNPDRAAAQLLFWPSGPFKSDRAALSIPYALPNTLEEIDLRETERVWDTFRHLEEGGYNKIKVLRVSGLAHEMFSYLVNCHELQELDWQVHLFKEPLRNLQYANEHIKELWEIFWTRVLPKIQKSIRKLCILPMKDRCRSAWGERIALGGMYDLLQGPLGPIGVINELITLAAPALEHLAICTEAGDKFVEDLMAIIQRCPKLKTVKLLALHPILGERSPLSHDVAASVFRKIHTAVVDYHPSEPNNFNGRGNICLELRMLILHKTETIWTDCLVEKIYNYDCCETSGNWKPLAGGKFPSDPGTEEDYEFHKRFTNISLS